MPSRWFAQSEVAPGTIIQLRKARWVIREVASEHCFQLNPDDLRDKHDPSLACTRLVCETHGPDGPVQGHMRYYKQIPIEGTEAEPPTTRAEQTESFCPIELKHLRALTQKGSTITPRLLDSKEDKQDNTGFVPGGFVTWVVWEVVPGLQLGNDVGSAPFWGLSPDERDAVRQAFKESICKLEIWGHLPYPEHAKNLVWGSTTGSLYYVGFLLTCKGDLRAVWSPAKWAACNKNDIWGLRIIVLYRPYVRYIRCLLFSSSWRNYDAGPTSFEQCKHHDRRTCSILPRYSKNLLAAQSAHAAAYIAIQDFTAGVTLGMMALSDPGPGTILDTKRGVAKSIALQRTLAASSVVSSQTFTFTSRYEQPKSEKHLAIRQFSANISNDQ
ncbi:hypothetical protein AAWM_05897 [Aspergillus awamori]|uniref:Uncharacterized protein n=1 Tax=Aspergillus awamori TaxID=105351 RepID=A0A401KUQ5_ASPAW|nr:hypothetical protein AAWM_05897 [Aspergillus awamori]